MRKPFCPTYLSMMTDIVRFLDSTFTPQLQYLQLYIHTPIVGICHIDEFQKLTKQAANKINHSKDNRPPIKVHLCISHSLNESVFDKDFLTFVNVLTMYKQNGMGRYIHQLNEYLELMPNIKHLIIVPHFPNHTTGTLFNTSSPHRTSLTPSIFWNHASIGTSYSPISFVPDLLVCPTFEPSYYVDLSCLTSLYLTHINPTSLFEVYLPNLQNLGIQINDILDSSLNSSAKINFLKNPSFASSLKRLHINDYSTSKFLSSTDSLPNILKVFPLLSQFPALTAAHFYQLIDFQIGRVPSVDYFQNIQEHVISHPALKSLTLPAIFLSSHLSTFKSVANFIRKMSSCQGNTFVLRLCQSITSPSLSLSMPENFFKGKVPQESGLFVIEKINISPVDILGPGIVGVSEAQCCAFAGSISLTSTYLLTINSEKVIEMGDAWIEDEEEEEEEEEGEAKEK
ncbi:uncharacterized protein SAPINGB_P006381 [Magnusiomyces paraingens]|uniref:Uncharacterized protein n=1 Tax=Magnusiomyces paraingens TaxID=2606893 RepID=A0A5E8C5V0_9ASCO|nr:uncharacterized protein SAPINGB_P006381 [Saprochaete ingens]VVT58782.1 unnamed protein product [Saprochaete ingens]